MPTIDNTLKMYHGMSKEMEKTSQVIKMTYHDFGAVQEKLRMFGMSVANVKPEVIPISPGIDVITNNPGTEVMPVGAGANMVPPNLGPGIMGMEASHQMMSGSSMEIEISESREAFKQLDEEICSAKQHIEETNRSAKSLGESITKFLKAHWKDGIEKAIRFSVDGASLYSAQEIAENQLHSAMTKGMGSDSAEIQSVDHVIASQKESGVVSDDLQLKGAGQLSSYVNSAESLKTLIPVMNDLAVRQNGVGVSAENMTGVASMMGQAMQGQIGELSSAGIAFTEAQEKVMQYGSEQEKAAVLAQVIEEQAGRMNTVMANTPQGKMEQLKNIWTDIRQEIGEQVYPKVMKFFEVIQANLPKLTPLIDPISNALSGLIGIFTWLIEGVSAVVSFFQENWSMLEPLIWGIAAGFLFMAAAMAIQTIATKLADAAMVKFFTTLLTNPLFWIGMIIGIIILLIYRWVQSVGGLEVAWLTVVDAVLTKGGELILGFISGWIKFQNAMDSVKYGFIVFKIGILDVLGSMKAKGLMILQNFVNSTIDMVNKLIDAVNQITDIGIKPIEWTAEFGTKAVEEEAKKKLERENEKNDAYQKMLDDAKKRDDAHKIMTEKFQNAHLQRELEKEEKRKKHEEKDNKDWFNTDEMGSGLSFDNGAQSFLGGANENIGNTAENTARMANSMDAMDDELKYMRDAAEQEIINRFTLAELKIDMSNQNTLRTETDFGRMADLMGEATGEILAAAAEGGHL